MSSFVSILKGAPRNLLLCLIIYLVQIAAGQSQPRTYTKEIAAFDNYVEQARKTWGAPGLSVAIVKDGQVLFTKGYGVRELGKPEPVDAKTLFICASTTKAMTATCMGMLVDEGKVNWDDPVSDYLPEFRLYDPYVSKELRVRDLFTHNSGVGNTDYLWTMMNLSSDEILQRMSLVKPSYSFRSSFIYQNIFYLAAGKVIEKVSGQPWEKFIKERIFDPLGMNRTVPFMRDVKDPNHVQSHFDVDGKTVVIQTTSADAIGPAGSVWSCAEDISKWVLCMVDSAKYPGGRLVKPATWVEMTKPQVMVPPGEFYPTMRMIHPNWTTYAMGWFQHDYKGKKVNFHTGSLDGAIAIHGQLPEERFGIYVFGNFDHAEVRHALMYKAFDLFALGGSRDWSSEFLKLYTGIREKGKAQEKTFEAGRVEGAEASHPLKEFEGAYSDPLFGQVHITQSDSNLKIDINGVEQATLQHWHYDTFYGFYDKKWYGHALAQFELNASGQVMKVNIDGMVFTRNAPQKR